MAASIGIAGAGLAGRFASGLFLSHEGHLDNRAVLRALGQALRDGGVTWREGIAVHRVAPRQLVADNGTHSFDWVADCRGLGAKADLPRLRGVRGELIYVSAPEVHLRRPVRLMHPRYPIYVVPRENQVYVIGATAIESEDTRPITLRSALELLSAAYSVHTGFAEGRLLETVAHCRPAFPDNRPRIFHQDGLLRINGLYRHGFLLSPILIQFACAYLEKGFVPEEAGPVLQECA